jgi:hypothetical protein
MVLWVDRGGGGDYGILLLNLRIRMYVMLKLWFCQRLTK